MALLTTGSTARLAWAGCLSALLCACATEEKPSVIAIPPEPQAMVQERFSEQGLIQNSALTQSQAIGTFVSPRELEENAPETYTVVEGDTLWDISGLFLKEPWLWPKIWDYNPQINDPHLIYPGDQLALEYVNGQATLVLTRQGERFSSSGSRSGSKRLSPRVRSESLDKSIPTIPADAIEQFLLHSKVVDAETLDKAPYIVGNYDNRLISALGHQVFARGDLPRNQTRYGIYRKSKALYDPVGGFLLGYELNHVADAQLMSTGDPSTLSIVSNVMETMNGDILLPSSEGSVAHNYTPRLPALSGNGRVVSLVNAISQAGRNQVIVLNVGQESGIKQGDVLAVETHGHIVTDHKADLGNKIVTLPNERTGVLMIFKTYEKVSYALVMESTRPIMVNDIVTGI